MAELTITREEQERAHKEKMAENLKKLNEGTLTVPESRTSYAAPAAPARPVERPLTANNAARIADYTAHPAPAKKVLFEDVTYHGQDVILRAPVAEPVRPAAMPAEAAPAAVSDPADALPTPRTMAMLNREAEESKQVGFFAALSPRIRTALVALAGCIVVFLAMICVNAVILSSLESDIAAQERENALLEQQHAELQGAIDDLLDSDTIADWAMENGMHK